MFTDEDAMDDDGAGGQTRYPTMPSLVALQQMKNRLHLAFLGKKLMKWTTIATGKELRKIAQIMNESFMNYSQDFSRAFIMLARARYYNPNLNTCVVNKVGNQAACVIELDHKSVAGVKVLTLELVDRGFDPNVHFGIEKGGETILDAKNTWKDLLRMAILMLQERTAFRLLDEANKAANK